MTWGGVLRLALLTVWVAVAASGDAGAAPVLMISVDGMKPEYITRAEVYGLKVPFLRKMMHDGAWAEGVTGVLPTITYPSHTTLLTGVPPAEHGIVSNAIFDPERAFDGAWFWYARAVRVPTLWAAAHGAGLRTASVGWPVSVGAAGVDTLLPEYWRGPSPGASAADSDRDLVAALARPDGVLDEMQGRLGPYMRGNETTVEGDEIKTRFAIDILAQRKPQFFTLHLSSLDETEHETGPFSAQSNRVMEAIDGMIGRLAAAAREADPANVVVVVSDHGFVRITHHVNLTIPFLKAGLIEMSGETNPEERSVTGWKAQLWMAGGTVAVMLHDRNDAATTQKTADLLHRLARNPANGIAEVLDRAGALKRGGFPDAAFVVLLRPGYYAGTDDVGQLVTRIDGAHGGHGFDPAFKEMRSSFFAAGPGIARRELGQIDMLQIAPTVARILGVPLPTAGAAPISL